MYSKFYLNHLHFYVSTDTTAILKDKVLNENLNFSNSQGPVKKFGKSRVRKIKAF